MLRAHKSCHAQCAIIAYAQAVGCDANDMHVEVVAASATMRMHPYSEYVQDKLEMQAGVEVFGSIGQLDGLGDGSEDGSSQQHHLPMMMSPSSQVAVAVTRCIFLLACCMMHRLACAHVCKVCGP